MGEVPGIAAVLSNLNADAVKKRERAALKDLKAHLDCQASCSALNKATADGLDSNQYPYVSWPSLIKLLVQNIKMYLNGQKNKPKPPNENYARILEKAVKIASGGYFYLWDCLPELYQHLVEVIVGFPTFGEIYAGILERLLNISEYRFEMDGKLYSEVLDFLLKDKASNNNVLFLIIKRPPVHLDNSLMPRLALRLSAIFAAMSERAHVKKWLGPVLGLLWHDGPNFGDHLLEFHPNASKVLIRHFPMLQGTDKDNPILYFRMQLKLRAVRDTSLTELFEFVDNELLRSTGDTPFLQLASHTIFEALKQGSSYSVNDSKRMKRMHVSEIVMERMSDPGCLSWTGAVCLLIKQYYSELPSDFLSGLLHSLVERLSFAVNEVLGWTIRCVNELCDAAVHHDKSLTGVNEWQRAWNTVVRIVSMRTAPSHVDDAFRLLGCLAVKELVPASVIPQSFWDLDYFKGAPSKSALFFVACYFSSTPSQCFELRKQLVKWSTTALGGQAAQICIHSKLLSAVFLALSAGLKFTDESRLLPSWSDMKSKEPERAQEAELAGIDMSEDVIVGCGSFERNLTSKRSQRACTMEMAQVIELLGILAESLTLSAQELLSVPSLELLFGLCVLVSECVAGVNILRKTRDYGLASWGEDGAVVNLLVSLLRASTSLVKSITDSSMAEKQFSDKAAAELADFVSVITDKRNVLPALEEFLEALVKRVLEIPTNEVEVHDGDAFEEPQKTTRSCWKAVCFSMISCLGQVLPQTYEYLLEVSDEGSHKVHQELIGYMCNCFRADADLSRLLDVMEAALDWRIYSDGVCYIVVSGVEKLLLRLQMEQKKRRDEELDRLSSLLRTIKKKKLYWRTRSKLGDAISILNKLHPDLPLRMVVLSLLNDPDFRVRNRLASHMDALFASCSDQRQLLKDLRSNSKVQLPSRTVSTIRAETFSATTALVMFGEIATASAEVETEAVFTVLAAAALQPAYRSLAIKILNRHATRLGYPDRWKILEQLLPGVLGFWVSSKIPLSRLVEIQDILAGTSDIIMYCVPYVLPGLLRLKQTVELQWLAQETSKPIGDLVQTYFPAVFYAVQAEDVNAWQITGLNEAARKKLAKEKIVPIVKHILLQVHADNSQYSPSATRADVEKILYDVLTRYDTPPNHVFTPGHVFELLLSIHKCSTSAMHWRHRRHCIAKLQKVVTVLEDGVGVPSTFRYALHIVLESLDVAELQSDCCALVRDMMGEKVTTTLEPYFGEQLQALVSKLVSVIVAEKETLVSSDVKALLHTITIEADKDLLPHLKTLDPFPDLPYFSSLRKWQSEYGDQSPFLTKFLKFVKRAPYLPPRLRLLSLQSFCKQLREIKSGANSADSYEELFSSTAMVNAVWSVTSVCNEEGDEDGKNLIAEFLAVAGFGDSSHFFDASLHRSEGAAELPVATVAHQLSLYLIDKDVSVIQLASTTAKSLFATEEGKKAFGKLNEGDKAYLEPHLQDPPEIIADKPEKTIDDPSLWITSGKTHDVWVSTLVHSLISYTGNTVLGILQRLVRVKSALAEFLFPYVFAELEKKITIASGFHAVISSQIRDYVFSDSNESTRSIQLFLLALHKLRIRYVEAATAKTKAKGPKWPKVYWLDVDYLVTAKAAERCAAYFTSIMYVELWCEEKFGLLTLGDSQFSGDNKLPEHLKQLLSVYAKINEPDTIYGLHHAQNAVAQVQLYEHENEWEKALKAYDLFLASSPEGEYHKGVLRALQHLGCSRVSQIYGAGLKSINEEVIFDKDFKELQYENAWKSGKWDLILDLDPLGNELGFNGRLHRSFTFLKDGHTDMFQDYVKKMRQEGVSHVVDNSRESSQNVHPELIKLLMVDCLSTAWNFRWPSTGSPAIPSDIEIQNILAIWKDMTKRTRGNHDLLEPLGSCMKVLLRVIEREDCLPLHLLEQSVLARKAGRLNQATAAVQELKRLCNSGSGVFVAGKIEEAKILRAMSQHEAAVKLMKYLLSTLGETEQSSAGYCLAGKWLIESKSASSRVVMESYLKKSVEIAQSCSSSFIKAKSKSNFHLAHFANAMYQSCQNRQNSDEWKSTVKLAGIKKAEAEAINAKRAAATTKAEQQVLALKYTERLREVEMDEREIRRLEKDMASYLQVALDSYQTCLLIDDKYDMRVVFRLVSLWFSLTTDQTVVDSMAESVRKVQSYKFIPLVYQIASRIGVSQTRNDFQFVLATLLKKMATQHPYHTIYQLFALSNGDRITESQKRKGVHIVDEEKKKAATELIAFLKNLNRPLIQEMEEVIQTYIRLAEIKLRDTEGEVDLPRDLKSKRFSRVPIITAHIPVRTNCNYDDLPRFTQFKPRVMIMKGVNRPKRVECVDSTGETKFQLVKSGNDDLRQDAVMEQLFDLVNVLLRHRTETRKRRLQLRTYKVVPFTPSAGATEWVSGTIPLGSYLHRAHSLLCTGDWEYMKCHSHMTNESDKRKAFREVCQHFRPAFRWFFRLKFIQVTNWFQKRLNYTRSVAANSMVGYIVGLGDRHSFNILIDETSAELVHIDFGVAFEQGLTLRFPETIPFRLTRDIVDGMGVTGTEGVFRRCCEATLSVMRANKEALLTIIEVFIHDPLFKWALTPVQAFMKQQEDAEEEPEGTEKNKNMDATRALMRVKWKLDGYEDGEMRTVEGQVQQLIQDAQDPERLCRLYPGWGAWL